MPQTRLSHGALSLVAPPPGVAHLSDALGAGVVAWITAPVAASGVVDGHSRLAAAYLRRSLDTYSIWQFHDCREQLLCDPYYEGQLVIFVTPGNLPTSNRWEVQTIHDVD